jgi:hypothetical protein
VAEERERSVKFSLDEAKQLLLYFGYEVNDDNIKAIQSERTIVFSSAAKAIINGAGNFDLEQVVKKQIEKLILGRQ